MFFSKERIVIGVIMVVVSFGAYLIFRAENSDSIIIEGAIETSKSPTMVEVARKQIFTHLEIQSRAQYRIKPLQDANSPNKSVEIVTPAGEFQAQEILQAVQPLVVAELVKREIDKRYKQLPIWKYELIAPLFLQQKAIEQEGKRLLAEARTKHGFSAVHWRNKWHEANRSLLGELRSAMSDIANAVVVASPTEGRYLNFESRFLRGLPPEEFVEEDIQVIEFLMPPIGSLDYDEQSESPVTKRLLKILSHLQRAYPYAVTRTELQPTFQR